jgi:hypothetical protein
LVDAFLREDTATAYQTKIDTVSAALVSERAHNRVLQEGVLAGIAELKASFAHSCLHVKGCLRAQLHSHSEQSGEHMRLALQSMRNSAADTQQALRTHLQQAGQSAAQQQEHATKELQAMQASFHSALGGMSQEVQQSVSTAVSDLLQQLSVPVSSGSGSGSELDEERLVAGIAATGEKLDQLLRAFEASSAGVLQLQKMLQAQHELVALMEARGNPLPSQFIVGPELRAESRSFVGKVKRKLYKAMWTKVRLYFVCEVSNEVATACGPEGEGYEIEIPTKALKAMVPVLLCSIAVLKAVLAMHGVPAGMVLPSIPQELLEDKASGLLDTLMDKSEELQQLVEQQEEQQEGVVGDSGSGSSGCSSGNGSGSDAVAIGGPAPGLAVQQASLDQLYGLNNKSEKGPKQMAAGWQPKHVQLMQATVDAATTAADADVHGRPRWVLQKHRGKYEQQGERAFPDMAR